jgi:hypothetical protein
MLFQKLNDHPIPLKGGRGAKTEKKGQGIKKTKIHREKKS